jgi:hypothetical protein
MVRISSSGVTGDQALRVEFAADTFSITATAGTGGRISPSGVVAITHADSRTFTMAADVGYTLSDVQVDGVSVGALESVLFTGTTDHHTIEAFFTRNSYLVSAEIEGLGTISPSETQAVDHGGSLTYTVTSGEGYHIEQVLINGTSAGGNDLTVFSLFLSHIVEETLIRADFGINTYTLTPVTDAHCRVEPAGPQVVDHGSTQTFDIRPNPNYQIDDVLVDGVSVGSVDTYTFTDVRAEHRLEVLVVEENSSSGGPCFISAVPGF